MDWISEATEEDLDLGATAFFGKVGAVLMGSRSFAGRLVHWPHGKRIVVLSSKTAKELDVPAVWAATVSCAPLSRSETHSLCAESLKSVLPCKAAVHMLMSEGVEEVAVVGASTVQRLMVEDWIDELTMVLVPPTLGRGIALLASDCQLYFVASRELAAGCMELRYATKSSK